MKLDDWFLTQELMGREESFDMPNLDGLTEERAKTIEKLEDVETLLLEAAADRIQRREQIEDVVVAVGGRGLDLSFIYLKDRGDGGTKSVSEAINYELAATSAKGAVVLRDGMWQGVKEEDTEMDALMISLNVRGWGRRTIVPYEIKDDHVVFHKAIVLPNADESLVWLFAES